MVKRNRNPTIMELNLLWGVPKCMDDGDCHGFGKYACVNACEIVHLSSIHPCTEHTSENKKESLKL